MNEPRRLIEEGCDSLQSQLLNVGRSYRASTRTRLRTAAALGLSISPFVTASQAAAKPLAASPLAKVATVGLLASGSAFLAYEALTPNEVSEPVVASAHVAVAPPVTSPAPSEPALQAPAEEEAAPQEEVAPEPAVRQPVVHSTPAPSSPRTNDLSAELARLDRARKKLAAGQPTAALEALDAYSRDFPRGSLRLEASVLRIEALAKAGRTAEAKERAKRFLAAHPNSVLTARVKRYAGE